MKLVGLQATLFLSLFLASMYKGEIVPHRILSGAREEE